MLSKLGDFLNWVLENFMMVLMGVLITAACGLILYFLLELLDPNYELKKVEQSLISKSAFVQQCLDTELYSRSECILLAGGIENDD